MTTKPYKPNRTEFEKPPKEKKVGYLRRIQQEREERKRLEDELYEVMREENAPSK
jgi:hypothetical protein